MYNSVKLQLGHLLPYLISVLYIYIYTGKPITVIDEKKSCTYKMCTSGCYPVSNLVCP